MRKTRIQKALVIALLTAVAAWNKASDQPASVSGDKAFAALLEGNARYQKGEVAHPNQSPNRRTEVAAGQHPSAVILTCADSRVSPEIVFDQGLGDLFVVRNAGNVLDDHTLGSIEYAVEHLGVHLVVVLGHSGCGAAKATLEGGHASGHIHSLVEAIQPALEASAGRPGDKLDNLVSANVERVAGQLQRIEPILSKAASSGELKVVGAKYDLQSGKVEVIGK